MNGRKLSRKALSMPNERMRHFFKLCLAVESARMIENKNEIKTRFSGLCVQLILNSSTILANGTKSMRS
jgi:hypothetical protein